MKKVTVGLRAIFVLIITGIAVFMYDNSRPLHVRQLDGVILSIESAGAFGNKKCYKITLAVNGIKKQPWELGKKTITQTNQQIFKLCVHRNQSDMHQVAIEAMGDIQKVRVTYIDDYYDFERKICHTKFIIATIKPLP